MKAKHSIKKVCEYCNIEFEASKSTTRYCSHKCNSRALKDVKRNEVIQLTEKLTKQKKVERVGRDVSNQEYLSISEAAILMGVSRWTIYRYVVDGKDAGWDNEYLLINPNKLRCVCPASIIASNTKIE